MTKVKMGGLAQPVYITGGSIDIPVSVEVNLDGASVANVFSVSNGDELVTAKKNLIPILSINPNTTISPRVIQILAEGGSCHFKILQNSTLTGASWANIHNVQYDIEASALSGGVELISGYVGKDSAELFEFPIGFFLDDTLTICAVRVGGKNADVGSAIIWI